MGAEENLQGLFKHHLSTWDPQEGSKRDSPSLYRERNESRVVPVRASCWDNERARAGAGRESKEAISKGKLYPQ